jgi:tRNA/rRNA methyltransferase
MNLAQAATVLLYLCSRAQLPALAAPPPPGAPLALVHRLEAKLQDTLTTAQFLNPQAPQHLLHELSRALVHGQLSAREVEVWIAAVDHLKRHLKP